MIETKMKTNSVSLESPLVSIILPIRNEARYIERCLNAVFAQDYPADRMEILIADGISTDGTREIVQRFTLHHSNVQLLDNPGKIFPTALNIGLRQGKGRNPVDFCNWGACYCPFAEMVLTLLNFRPAECRQLPISQVAPGCGSVILSAA
ncbi:MAG: glycosyltransferase [Nanoarchaeota archaeon]|nr:glycosyltransferase [Nanoarchaeota archaeon]